MDKKLPERYILCRTGQIRYLLPTGDTDEAKKKGR